MLLLNRVGTGDQIGADPQSGHGQERSGIYRKVGAHSRNAEPLDSDDLQLGQAVSSGRPSLLCRDMATELARTRIPGMGENVIGYTEK